MNQPFEYGKRPPPPLTEYELERARDRAAEAYPYADDVFRLVDELRRMREILTWVESAMEHIAAGLDASESEDATQRDHIVDYIRKHRDRK